MSHKASKKEKIQKLLTIPTAILASGIIVGLASHSTLLASRSANAEFQAGIINLTANKSTANVKLFEQDENIKRIKRDTNGKTGKECVLIKANSNYENSKVLLDIKQDPALAKSLDNNIIITATKGKQTDFNKDCTGFIPDDNSQIKNRKLASLRGLTKASRFTELDAKVEPEGKETLITYEFIYEIKDIGEKLNGEKSEVEVEFKLNDQAS